MAIEIDSYGWSGEVSIGGTFAAAGEVEIESFSSPVRLALPPGLRLGTSSWSYPGWANLVWDGEYAETVLSKSGLSALARHPLFRTVSLDRNFYRALTASQYARYAAMVPDVGRRSPEVRPPVRWRMEA